MKTALIAALAILLTACSSQQTASPATPSATHATVGLPNPASVNCEKQGGTLDLRKDVAGNVSGVCVFADGRQCEEWALFRDHQCVPLTASPTKDGKP